MSSVRIAFIVDKCAPYFVGGYEDRFFHLARFLSRRHDVHVFTSLDKTSAEVDGIHFHRLISMGGKANTRGSRSYLHGLTFALSLISDPTVGWNPDVLIVEAIPYLHLATMRRWAAKSRAVRLLNVNEAWVNYQNIVGPLGPVSTRAVRSLLSIGIDWADVVIPISDVTARTLATSFHPRKSLTVPMGFDPAFADLPRSRFSVSADFDFVFVGRLVLPKRPADFLHALAELKARHGWKGRAVLVGEGPLHDDLVRLRSQLGLESNLTITGMVSAGRRNAILRQSRIFVLPSEREGFSLATLEGMAFGLVPVVARPASQEVFGVSQLVRDGVSGLLFDVGDISDLAAKLQELLTETESYRRMSIAAMAVASQYTWQTIGSRFEADLQDLVTTK